MDWETTPVSFICSIIVSASIGALAAGVKEINGESFSPVRFFCRTFYRTVLTTIAGLFVSTSVSDLRLLWGATIFIAIKPVKEETIMNWLPFNVHHKANAKNRRSSD